MSIADLFQKIPNSLQAGSDRQLTVDEVELLTSMHSASEGAIDEAIAGLEVIADYLYASIDSTNEIELNSTSWTLKSLAATIDHAVSLKSDCDFFLSNHDKATRGELSNRVKATRRAKGADGARHE